MVVPGRTYIIIDHLIEDCLGLPNYLLSSKLAIKAFSLSLRVFARPASYSESNTYTPSATASSKSGQGAHLEVATLESTLEAYSILAYTIRIAYGHYCYLRGSSYCP
jgi:hypothetical protein